MKQALGKCPLMVSLWTGSVLSLEFLCNIWIPWEITEDQNRKQIRIPGSLHFHITSETWHTASNYMKRDASTTSVPVTIGASITSPFFFSGGGKGEIQIPALVTSEPITAHLDTNHIWPQHIKLSGQLNPHNEWDMATEWYSCRGGNYFLLIISTPSFSWSYAFFSGLKFIHVLQGKPYNLSLCKNVRNVIQKSDGFA